MKRVTGRLSPPTRNEVEVRLAAVTGEVARLSNRAWREVVAKVPVVSSTVNKIYQRRLQNYRPHLAPLAPSQRHLLDDLATTGVVITDLDHLGLPAIAMLKESLGRLADGLATRPRTEISPVRPSRADLLVELDLWQWGLREEVLDFVEHYLGLPARYYGADVRREGANGKLEGVRQWHRDIEDHRVFKILVWLSDVGPTDGSMEWVPRDVTAKATKELGYVAGYLKDSDMATVVLPELWRTAEGPRWTALVADTRNVFHRAGTPQERDRYSVTFTWTSRYPVKTMPVDPFTPEQAALIRGGLNARQLACLPRSLMERSARWRSTADRGSEGG